MLALVPLLFGLSVSDDGAKYFDKLKKARSGTSFTEEDPNMVHALRIATIIGIFAIGYLPAKGIASGIAKIISK